MLDSIHLSSADARATIHPGTGGVVSMFEAKVSGTWRPVLAPARPGFDRDPTKSSAFAMVPWCNRLSSGGIRSSVGFHPIPPNWHTTPFPVHGLGWLSRWSVRPHRDGRASLFLSHDAADPYSFEASMDIGLEGAAIAFGLRVRNTGRIALPFGLGFHPYFPRDAGTNLRLPAATVFPIDKDGLPLNERSPGEDEDFRTESSVGLRALSGIYPAAGPVDIGQTTFGTRLSFIGAEFLQIWAPAEAPYFCVEPVSHSIDSFADPAGSSRYGLEPGEMRELQVRIEPWEARPDATPKSHGEAKSPACQTDEENNGS